LNLVEADELGGMAAAVGATLEVEVQ